MTPKRGRPPGTTKDDSKQGVVRFRCEVREKSRWVKRAQKEDSAGDDGSSAIAEIKKA